MNKCKQCLVDTTNDMFCSSKCSRDYYRQQRTILSKQRIKKCFNCNNLTYTKFCSQSCSAIYNNQQKLKVAYHCQCGTLIGLGYQFKNKKYCKNCEPVPTETLTLEQLKLRYKQLSNYHSAIRQHARKQCASKSCYICGYDKHVETCHIIPVSDFDMQTLISVVNDPTNLVSLCPNHHWEFDNGLISL